LLVELTYFKRIMTESIHLVVRFKTKPSSIYEAWLDSDGHSQMTGGVANCSNLIGASFNAWDGYIEGQNLNLIPNKEINQTWRTSEFQDDDKDSQLTIRLEEIGNETELTLIHTNIPEGQTQYEQGWKEHYFQPMHDYFD
jgi:activator of HSP90 ATPase